MNTATQPSPTTEQADRFRCESDVPDPPSDPAGRKQYWDDTVAEAVAELRRRLASTRDEKSFQALEMILDLEKTRLRHKAPVAGTEVGGGGGWADGLEPLPVYTQCDREFAPKKTEAKTGPHPVAAQPPSPCDPEPVAQAGEGSVLPPLSPVPAERGTSEGEGPGVRADGSRQTDPPLPSYPFPPKPLRPIPLRERLKLQSLHKGVIGHFHDHDDDYLLERGQRRKRDDAYAAELDDDESSAAPVPTLPAADAPDRDTGERLLW